jgi:hypothetical protein
VILAIAVGLLAGAHAATWGAYKDSPFEGFHARRQVRSLAIAVGLACLVAGTGAIDGRDGVVLAGVVYAGERLATEWWKTILREDDQAAYSIPMRLGFLGRPVDRRWVRYSVGALVASGLGASALALHITQAVFAPVPWWLLVVTVGGAGGWLTAVGGAWKDAPIEGFSGWKFLRSPLVATSWALPLSALTDDWLALCLAPAGLAVATIETYKTFLTGGRPPGKFATRPVRFHLPAVRHVTGLFHAATWAAAAAALMLVLADEPAILADPSPEGTTASDLARVAVLVVALVMAASVVRANGSLATLPAPAPKDAAGGSRSDADGDERQVA